jgi:hypothetical protein
VMLLLLLSLSNICICTRKQRAFYIGTQRSRLVVKRPAHRPRIGDERWCGQTIANHMQDVVVLC